MDSTSPCNSLISFLFKLLDAHWSDQNLFDKNQKPLLTIHLSRNCLWDCHLWNVLSKLSPWTERNTDSHSQPNSVWLSVSMTVPYYLIITIKKSRAIWKVQKIGLRYIKNCRTFDDEFLFTFILMLVTVFILCPCPLVFHFLCLLEKGKSRLQDAMEFLATQWANHGG